MSLILAQFVSEVLLTMCIVYQDLKYLNYLKKQNYKSYLFHHLFKSSLVLKFNIFNDKFTTSFFISFHPSPIGFRTVYCLVSGHVTIMFYNSKAYTNQNIQFKRIST